MTTEIPDPATLSGEELNYWTGVAAGKNIANERGSSKKSLDNDKWYSFERDKDEWIRWNPTQDAAQCLEITPKCDVMWNDDYGYCCAWVDIGLPPVACPPSPTELIARCRAFLEAKRRST